VTVARARQFQQGEVVASMAELIEALERQEWLYLSHKVMSPSFLGSMQFWSLRNFVGMRAIRRAVRIAPAPIRKPIEFTEIPF
jgi:hypothetical protein